MRLIKILFGAPILITMFIFTVLGMLIIGGLPREYGEY